MQHLPQLKLLAFRSIPKKLQIFGSTQFCNSVRRYLQSSSNVQSEALCQAFVDATTSQPASSILATFPLASLLTPS